MSTTSYQFTRTSKYLPIRVCLVVALILERVGGRSFAGAGAGAMALALALGLTACSSSAPAPAPSTTASATVPATTSTPSPTATHPPTPAIRPVAASAPTHFTMQGKGFTIAAHVCGMGYVRPLDPPGEQHHTVCWVQHDFGEAPGSHSRTTYILGHAWAEDDLEVLNKASRPATLQILDAVKHAKVSRLDGIPVYPVTALNGSTITLRTATGTLTYEVRDVYGVAKNQAGDVHSLMNQKTPRRVVIITCAEAHGIDYDYDIIVDAYLVKAVPSSAS